MKNTIIGGLCMLLLNSCLKLDSNLYNNKNDIHSYELDGFTGEQDFVLDSNYMIRADRITQLTLASKGENESTASSIRAIYIGDVNSIAKDTVILYCHGNKWHMDFYWQRAKLLAHVNGKMRYGLMMMDYRGFGLSEGKPAENSLRWDVEACINWLKEKGLSGDRLVVYGFSLGSVPACELTAFPGSLRPQKLILEAPIGSSEIMVQDGSQLNMPAAYFTDLKIDNAEKIKSVNQPLLWIHGLSDNFLNYQTHGQSVYDNHNGTYKEKFLVEGADHDNVPIKMGFDLYLKTLGDFIRRK